MLTYFFNVEKIFVIFWRNIIITLKFLLPNVSSNFKIIACPENEI